MEFRLIYDGPLKAAAGVDDKHDLRKAFHEQFKVLWKQIPLSDNQGLLEDPPKKNHISVITGFNLEMVKAGLAEVYRKKSVRGLDLRSFWEAERNSV